VREYDRFLMQEENRISSVISFPRQNCNKHTTSCLSNFWAGHLVHVPAFTKVRVEHTGGQSTQHNYEVTLQSKIEAEMWGLIWSI
jgi:hypothetical protein